MNNSKSSTKSNLFVALYYGSHHKFSFYNLLHLTQSPNYKLFTSYIQPFLAFATEKYGSIFILLIIIILIHKQFSIKRNGNYYLCIINMLTEAAIILYTNQLTSIIWHRFYMNDPLNLPLSEFYSYVARFDFLFVLK